MIKKSSTFVSGVVAVGIYIFAMGLLLFYFNTRNSNKSIHYVKKDENRIRVSVSTPKNTSKIKKHKSPTTKSSEKSTKKNNSTHKKNVHKKKPKVINKTPQKKVNKPKSLFDSVDTNKPEKKNNPIKASDKRSAGDMVSSSPKVQDVSDTGIEDSYKAHIERLLYEFPAESDYAGEEIRVSLHIERDGSFTFRLISISANNDFNQEFEAYLKQLQSIGFGTHKGNRAYEIDVEFIATE